MTLSMNVSQESLCRLSTIDDDDDFGCTCSLVKQKCISLSLGEKIKHAAAIFNDYQIISKF